MLLRSVAFDRWMTVLVSLGLIVGARAAMRGRSWGLLLAFASACWYLAVFFLGMAPLFFVPFAIVAALPLLKAWRAFTGFDRGAAKAAAAIAASAGAGGALGWKAALPWLADTFPALTPTFEAHHGAALIAILSVAIAIAARDRRASSAEAQTGPRVASAAPPVRIAAGLDMPEALDVYTDEVDEAAPVRTRRSSGPLG